MKKKLKTSKVLVAHNILANAKYGKMESADRIKVWKIARKLAPVAEKFDADTKDAAEKMKPTEDFNDRLQAAQEFEKAQKDKTIDATKLKMGAAEYQAFVKELQAYNKEVEEAVKEFGEKEIEIEFEPISESAFEKLMDSNDWNFAQATEIGNLVIN